MGYVVLSRYTITKGHSGLDLKNVIRPTCAQGSQNPGSGPVLVDGINLDRRGISADIYCSLRLKETDFKVLQL